MGVMGVKRNYYFDAIIFHFIIVFDSDFYFLWFMNLYTFPEFIFVKFSLPRPQFDRWFIYTEIVFFEYIYNLTMLSMMSIISLNKFPIQHMISLLCDYNFYFSNIFENRNIFQRSFITLFVDIINVREKWLFNRIIYFESVFLFPILLLMLVFSATPQKINKFFLKINWKEKRLYMTINTSFFQHLLF